MAEERHDQRGATTHIADWVGSRRRLLSGVVSSAMVSRHVLAPVTAVASQSPTADQTVEFEIVATPADYHQRRSHQRLVELQLWHDRIYVGHGDWSANTGPVQAVYLDLPTGTIVHDDWFSFDDEAIESFVVLDDVLYAIGTDALAVEGWAYGNLYRKWWGGVWEKLHTVPGGVHLFSLGQFGGSLVAAGSDSVANGVVWQSWDNGWTWQVIATVVNPSPASLNPLLVRSHVFSLADRLVVVTPQESCFVVDGVSWLTQPCTAATPYGVAKSVQLGNLVVMTPYVPGHIYGESSAQQLMFFDGQDQWAVDVGGIVRDVVVDGESLYALVTARNRQGSILGARDVTCRCAEAFVEVATISRDYSMPLSLTRANDRFYAGCEHGQLIQSSPSVL